MELEDPGGCFLDKVWEWLRTLLPTLVRKQSHSPYLAVREAEKYSLLEYPGRGTGFDVHIAMSWSYSLISIHLPFNNSLAFYARHYSRLWDTLKIK